MLAGSVAGRTLAGAVLVASAWGCSERAVDTPEECFVKVKAACAERDWARLFDALPPETQEWFLAQVAETVQQIAAHAKVTAEQTGLGEREALERILTRELKVTLADWESMLQRDRFSVWFEASGGGDAIRVTGFDPEIIAASDIASSDVRGGTAELVVDDGKGHRTPLTFVLVDRIWRLDLGYD